MKRCTKKDCGEKHYGNGYCYEHYQADYYKKNSEKCKRYYAKNREAIKQKTKDRYFYLKQVVYDTYGCICNCCGEEEPTFLSIDHVNNDGHIDVTTSGRRIAGSTLYDRIIKENFPDSYQILCMNCNFGKKINNGVCPHEKA